MEHRDIQKGNVHVIHNFEFTDITERDAYIPSVEDLKKICLVNSPFSYYALRSISPTVWEGLGGGTTSNPVTQSEITKSSTNPSTNKNPSELGALWVNYATCEIFICSDKTQDQNIWQGNKGTIISPKPVYKYDLLGDNSAVSFLQLENNLTDEGGKYTISTANTIYESGKIGNCLKTISDSGKLEIKGAMKAISFWAFFPNTVTNYGYFLDSRGFGTSASYSYFNTDVSFKEIRGLKIFENKIQKNIGNQVTKGAWVNIAINFDTTIDGIALLSYSTPSYGVTNVKIDHVRCFNRTLTSSDLDKLLQEA